MTRQLKISRWQMTSRDQRIILYERAGRLAIAAARPAPRPNRPRVVSVAHCNLEGRSKLLVMAPPPRRLYTHIYGIAPYVSYVTKQLGLRVNTVAPPLPSWVRYRSMRAPQGFLTVSLYSRRSLMDGT